MLTKKQREIYIWIKEFIAENGYAPSYAEIMAGLGLRSLNTVHYHIKQLDAKGVLKSPWGNRKRAMEVVGESEGGGGVRLALLGEVAAGKPVEAFEAPEDVDLPAGFFGRGDHFALRVRGDSMIDEGIHDGDVIVVRKSAGAENGQVVVAQVDGEATVKKYNRRGAAIELVPANPAYKTIVADESRVQVLGAVVALYRKY